MVDALERAISHLRSGGLLIDTRPDERRRPRVLSQGRVVGQLLTSDEVALDDEAANRAVASMVRRGLLRRLESGHLWHQTSFADRREFATYVRESSRYSALAPGARIPANSGPIVMRRAIRFEILVRR